MSPRPSRNLLRLLLLASLLLPACGKKPDDKGGNEEARKTPDVKPEEKPPAPEQPRPERRPANKNDEDNDTYEGKPLREWLTLLREGDEKARPRAAELLGEIAGKPLSGTDPATLAAALGDALVKDKSSGVRKAAVTSLRRIGPPAVAALVNAVKTGDHDARKLAIPALVQTANSYPEARPAARKVVPALIGILKAEDENLRQLAATALGALDQSGESLPGLLELSGADDEAGKAAREVLQRMRQAPRSAAPALLNFLKDPEPRVRLKAAEVLCELEEGDKECLAALLELIKRRDSQVRLGAATLLRRYGSAARPALAALLEVVRNDRTPDTRQAAIAALLAIGPEARKDLLPALIEVVRNDTGSDPRHDVRLTAISSLGAIGPEAKAAVPVIKAAEADYQKQVEEARAALGRAKGREVKGLEQSVRLCEWRVSAVKDALKKIEP